ncbi:gas vesicle protein [Solirubrobacter ginsenosidimutans]|uniref:Gas vesicle protein n=1 Tax=Solirubrobacter ginsenosidimutans TaxID=490573 RepID=A0A9X3MZ60_9ACTN|nr:gas vesicle protein GvpO [Solirubrobacter ginsenosidimutans]MDA0165681.1 gas vesicle protein [Solirubrobacter ginsenosidimutans]
MEPASLVQQARQQVSELTGMPAEAVTGLRRDDSGWTVTVEALELARVPSTMDVLGTYEITLSDEGRLLGLRHVGRHRRSATDHGGS